MKNVYYPVAVIVLVLATFASPGQRLSNTLLWKNLAGLDTNRVLSVAAKLQLLYEWKRESEAEGLPQDSVFARLLHKTGVYEFYSSKNYNKALAVTMQALRINTSGKPGGSTSQAATDLYNIAFYYDRLELLRKALPYYDSAILFAARGGRDVDGLIADSRNHKAYAFFRLGDFQKAAEESDRARISALEGRDSLGYVSALNQRAQALFFQGKLRSGLEDARTAIALGRRLREKFQLASALKSQAFLLGGLGDLTGAEISFRQCIAERVKTNSRDQVAADYNDLGNFYSDSLKSFYKAGRCHLLAIEYARKESDSVTMATAFINLGRDHFYLSEFEKADSCYRQAMRCLKIGRDFVAEPSLAELGLISNKDVIQTLIDSRTALLLAMYRRSGDKKWLSACMRTALLSDSLIGEIRHEQVGEQSKLYWRKRTRAFFAHALEASYFAGDDRLAFYFMEKSRSVLLQDKLNELGASAYLPPQEEALQEKLEINLIELQQRLAAFPDTSAARVAGQKELLAAKERLEQYIQSLESRYPAYFQYKYADSVVSLASLQEFLAKNNQSFVDYFLEDTVCYALWVQPRGTRFLRVSQGGRNYGDQLSRFINFCSDENALNKDFRGFLRSSNEVYELLVKPFALKSGRVIVCQDSYLVPFEALTRDPGKADFLVKDFAFSYVYSARWLMSRHEQRVGTGDFLGIAPVSFSAYNGLADLRLSEEALRSCSAPYGRVRLLLHAGASRGNFIRQVCDYKVATILTHARADSADEEPVLFMNDSVIRLSELQMLSRPAARLIVLSGCQTNVGKNRSGEGIFSLARGFSAAGIPAVAATQWMADEGAIYCISQKFNEYIFQGMNKDEALQKAKLFYMLEDRKGSLLPCYWADMVLIGDTEPVPFSRGAGMGWIVEALVTVVLLGAFGLYWVRIRRRIP